MDDYLHRPYMGLPYDYRRLEAWLMDMAEMGWRLDRIGTLGFFQFVKDAPGKVQYAVTYSADVSPYDAGPTEEELALEELCTAAGWKKAASSAQMQIYWNPDPNAVPLETDDLGRIRGIRRAMNKQFFPQQYLLMGLFLFQLLMQWISLKQNPMEFLSRTISVGLLPMFGVLIGGYAATILGALLWLHRAEAAAAKGTRIPAMGFYRWVQGITWAALVCFLVLLTISGAGGLAIWAVVLAVLMLVGIATALAFLKELGAPRWVNFVVPTVVAALLLMVLLPIVTLSNAHSLESAAGPIAIADLSEDFSADTESLLILESASPVLSYTYHQEDSEAPGDREHSLSCQVMDSEFDFALDLCWEYRHDYLKNRGGEVRDISAEVGIPCWGLINERGNTWFALRWESRVVYLYAGWTLTAEQLQRAIGILQP